MKKLLLILFLPVPMLAMSATKSKNGNLHFFVSKVSNLTGKKYVMNQVLKGNVMTTKNFKLDEANGDQFISRALFLNGYTRIPLQGEEGFMVVHSRDVRYMPVKQVFSDKNTPPELPNNHDYYQLTYEAENPENMMHFVRSARPFLSRYGRIINIKHNNLLMIQDTAANLSRLFRLVVKFDTPLDPRMRKQLESERERNFEIKKIQASKPAACTNEKDRRGKKN